MRLALLLALAAAAMGCATGHGCGIWVPRADGAICQECWGPEGSFARCHKEFR